MLVLSLMVDDGGCSTRNSIYSGFIMVPPFCRTDCFKRSVCNGIVPMLNYLPSNVHHNTNYSSFISSLKRLMFEKMHTSWSVVIVVHGVLIVIAAYHNTIIKD